MKLSAALILVSVVLAGGVTIKTMVFPSETPTSYVEMVPQKPLNMNAFTLCMRVATELSGEREVILFAYRTADFDELNVWRELDGR
ncbi:C-reactive protein-like [Sebastes fasciatus]|uniref:C-reactive protein-like n=1 Tax=Sebastes fasciatus TaxID=394691 RepID=UPI003D9E980E